MPKQILQPHLVPLAYLELEQKQILGGEIVSSHFSPGKSGRERLRGGNEIEDHGAGTVETPLN